MAANHISLVVVRKATIATLSNSTWGSSSSSTPTSSNTTASTQSTPIPTFALSIIMSLLLLVLGIWKRHMFRSRRAKVPNLPLYTASPNIFIRRSTDPLPQSQDPRIRTTLPHGHEFAMTDIDFSQTQKGYKGTGRFGLKAIKTMQKGFDVVNNVAQDIHMLGGL